MKEKSTQKTKKQEQQEREIMDMLAKSQQTKGEQLNISPEGELNSEKEIKDFALGMDNPVKKYDVYYKGIMRLLRKHLPSGSSNRKSRNYIYEEKNTFLTRGKRIGKDGIRGADSRMGYLVDAKEVFKIVMNWVRTNGSTIELFTALRDLNTKKGYGMPKY